MTVSHVKSHMFRSIPPLWSLVFISIIVSPIVMFFPFQIALFGTLAIMLVAFCVRPMLAVYLITAAYALESCVIELHFENASFYFAYIRIYLFEILNLINLAVIVLSYLTGYHGRQIRAPHSAQDLYKWIFFFLAAFIAWSAYTALLSPKAAVAFLGWWKLNCNFVMMGLIITHLDSYKKFISVMSLYCGVALVFSLVSIYATYHAFETTKMLYLSPDISVSLKMALFNRPGGVLEKLNGIVNGFGLCGKHPLGMLMLAGMMFSVFLAKHYKSMIIKAVLIGLICLFEMILYTNFMKLSLTASFLILLLASLAVFPFRKYFIPILALFVCLNIVGWMGSKVIQTPHLRVTDEVINKLVTKVPVSSQFQVGSIAHRVYVWEQTLDKILKNPLLGSGPESLRKDLVFDLPHGHNLFLTLAAEYGIPAGLLISCFFILMGVCGYRSIFSKQRMDGMLRFLRLTFFAAVGGALFEYFFDCDVWYPHLWLMLAFLLASMKLENGCQKFPETTESINRECL